MRYRALLAVFGALFFVAGCQSVASHREAVSDTEGEAVTVGTVQREIREGMSGAEVAAALGSPNIVTSDKERRETWIYDKISTNRAYSRSSGGINALILGGALTGSGAVGGGAGIGASSSTGAETTSQRTLTVIIKFDNDGLVRDFAYHTSRF
jgi:outer membrane protein assembly factor BamE (lipoprotein component of BamABCDE complex)